MLATWIWYHGCACTNKKSNWCAFLISLNVHMGLILWHHRIFLLIVQMHVKWHVNGPTWACHMMEMLYTLMAYCEGNSLVTCGFSPKCGDYKNPLHLDVADRYLRWMGDKTIPDEAPLSLESFYPPWVAGIDLPQSRCCGFFVSFTNKHNKGVFQC